MSSETRCLFDSTKICPEDCKLREFIEIAKNLGAVWQNTTNLKDQEIEMDCKLKEN